MVLEIFCILVLLTPTAWELYDDYRGDDHNGKNDDWKLRGLLMLVSAITVWLINPHRNFAQAFILTFAMFAALFPYLINIIHYKRGVTSDPKWWSHLSKTAIPDKWISFIPWYLIMLMYAILLGAAIKIYICLDAFKSWYGCK